MNNVNNKIIISVILVIGIAFVVIGATFAYYVSSTSNNNSVNGVAGSPIDISMTLTTKKSGNLIPLKSSLVSRTISSDNKCVDYYGNDICSYYQINFVNSGSAETLVGYVKTENTTNKYTTDHLHFMLFNSSYVAVSSESIISPTVGTKNYILNGNSNLSLSIPNGNSTYYLVVWLNDDNTANQVDDINKKFVGSLEFESSNGANLSAILTT